MNEITDNLNSINENLVYPSYEEGLFTSTSCSVLGDSLSFD